MPPVWAISTKPLVGLWLRTMEKDLGAGELLSSHYRAISLPEAAVAARPVGATSGDAAAPAWGMMARARKKRLTTGSTRFMKILPQSFPVLFQEDGR